MLRADSRAAFSGEGRRRRTARSCVNWVLSAKRADTRDRRMAQLVDACRELRLVTPLPPYDEPARLRRLRSELGESARARWASYQSVAPETLG